MAEQPNASLEVPIYAHLEEYYSPVVRIIQEAFIDKKDFEKANKLASALIELEDLPVVYKASMFAVFAGCEALKDGHHGVCCLYLQEAVKYCDIVLTSTEKSNKLENVRLVKTNVTQALDLIKSRIGPASWAQTCQVIEEARNEVDKETKAASSKEPTEQARGGNKEAHSALQAMLLPLGTKPDKPT